MNPSNRAAMNAMAAVLDDYRTRLARAEQAQMVKPGEGNGQYIIDQLTEYNENLRKELAKMGQTPSSVSTESRAVVRLVQAAEEVYSTARSTGAGGWTVSDESLVTLREALTEMAR
jgi:hypothetical protein